MKVGRAGRALFGEEDKSRFHNGMGMVKQAAAGGSMGKWQGRQWQLNNATQAWAPGQAGMETGRHTCHTLWDFGRKADRPGGTELDTHLHTHTCRFGLPFSYTPPMRTEHHHRQTHALPAASSPLLLSISLSSIPNTFHFCSSFQKLTFVFQNFLFHLFIYFIWDVSLFFFFHQNFLKRRKKEKKKSG